MSSQTLTISNDTLDFLVIGSIILMVFAGLTYLGILGPVLLVALLGGSGLYLCSLPRVYFRMILAAMLFSVRLCYRVAKLFPVLHEAEECLGDTLLRLLPIMTKLQKEDQPYAIGAPQANTQEPFVNLKSPVKALTYAPEEPTSSSITEYLQDAGAFFQQTVDLDPDAVWTPLSSSPGGNHGATAGST